ncbi:hypothetical protein GCM10028778_10430 [Barrientosiimonas marina]|uniref:Site-2 protease family protein n=1 Tax=Lentibacillus kimchii TaxID=1542911 RepID=A0ABW2UY16_9BACI
MTIQLLIYLIFIAAPVGNILHELGHAAAARLFSADRITLSIGTGHLLYHMKLKHMAVFIHLMFFLGGMAASERQTPYRKHEQIIMAAFGPVTSALTAVLCSVVLPFYPNRYLLLFLLFNAWVALVNLIPFRFNGKQSDGYTIFNVIREKYG